MKRAPRPKTQPVVMMWMWRGIVANGMILTVCIFCTYMIALWAYAGAFLTEDISDPTRQRCAIWPKDEMKPTLKIDCAIWKACSGIEKSPIYDAGCAVFKSHPMYVKEQAFADDLIKNTPGATGALYVPHGSPECAICIDESIRRARTCAFIALVWAENFRAYCSRSFDNGVWVNTFANPSMNKAILMAQIALYVALFTPGLNHVLGLYVEEIHGFGWFLAIMGALACLIFCEIYKFVASRFIAEAELANFSGDDTSVSAGDVALAVA
jgi:magnesium-transporting ATPase (P-type)